MQKGKEYLVGLTEAASITPKEGSWANIRYQDTGKTVEVTPVLTTEWDGQTVVHIFALKDAPDPQMLQDELVYRDKDGNGESRTIMSFTLLRKG